MDDQWKTRVDDRLSALETKAQVDEVHRGNVVNRLDAIEDTLKWLVRLVIGALILAIVAFVVDGGLIP